MDNFVYSNPVRMLFGRGQLDRLPEEILGFGRRVLLVTGKKFAAETGIDRKVKDGLAARDISYIELPGVQPNPRVARVRDGAEICKREGIQFVLGVGGGSVADSVKAIGFAAKVDYDPWLAFGDFNNIAHGNRGDFPHVPKETLPTGVVMTKPGTGAEFDYTSVITNADTREKLGIINKVLYPRFCLIDPEFAYTLPLQEACYGVADIMTHVMEQYFAPTPDVEILDRYREANLRVAIDCGRRILEDQRDYAAQTHLFYVAAWACSDQSMAGSRGGWESHLISHEFTAATDLNHGHAVSIVMYGWMRAVLEHLPAKFARFAENVWGVERRGRSDVAVGREGIERTADYWRSLGITLRFGECGVPREVVALAARQAVRFGPLGVITTLREEDIFSILDTLY